MRVIKKLLHISRPISWPNTAYPFAAGYLLSGGSLDWIFAIGTLYFLIPYNLLMYGINDVYDYESDLQNPRKGGVEGAVEAKVFHPTIIRAIIWSNLPFLIALLLTGSFTSKLILLGVIFAAIIYSMPPLRTKERPLADSVTSSLHFVGPLVFALSFHTSSLLAWLCVAAFFLWGIASHASGAVQDIIPDRAAKIHSIATRFGAATTMRLSFLSYLASCMVLFFSNNTNAIIAGILLLIYCVNIFPYLSLSDKNSGRANHAWRRFLWLNYIVGFGITLLLILAVL